MQKWKHRHDSVEVENAVEISRLIDGVEHAFFVFYSMVTRKTSQLYETSNYTRYNQNSSRRMMPFFVINSCLTCSAAWCVFQLMVCILV